MMPLIGPLQQTHLVTAGEHRKQRAKWPHGMTSLLASWSLQILQSRSAFNRLFSLRRARSSGSTLGWRLNWLMSGRDSCFSGDLGRGSFLRTTDPSSVIGGNLFDFGALGLFLDRPIIGVFTLEYYVQFLITTQNYFNCWQQLFLLQVSRGNFLNTTPMTLIGLREVG